MFPTANILERVRWIQCGDLRGTAFAIEVKGRQFLVTARHVVEAATDGAPIQRFDAGRWLNLDVAVAPPDPDFVDVALLVPVRQECSAPAVRLGSDGMVLGQDVFILGFPFGVVDFDSLSQPTFMASGTPLPMIKRGVLSWLTGGPGAGHQTLFLDCYANAGFSGGPAFGFPALRGSGEHDLSIMGVVTHYAKEHKPVVEGPSHRQTALTAETNPGILVVAGINHAVEGAHQLGPNSGAPFTVTRM